jgi:ABC-type glycerol-3-phosphate transport system substrate-binding protein
VWPKTPSSPKILQTLVDQLALAIQGKQTAKAALEQAQQSWEQELAK